MAYADPAIGRLRERFRKRTAERIVQGLPALSRWPTHGGAQRMRPVRRQAQPDEPRPRRPAPGDGEAAPEPREVPRRMTPSISRLVAGLQA